MLLEKSYTNMLQLAAGLYTSIRISQDSSILQISTDKSIKVILSWDSFYKSLDMFILSVQCWSEQLTRCSVWHCGNYCTDIVTGISLIPNWNPRATWSYTKWGYKCWLSFVYRTDTLLQKLIQYTMTRGLFVTADQVVGVILFLVNPENSWW